MITRTAFPICACLLASASAEAGFISYLDLPKHESYVSLSIDGVQVGVEASDGTFMTRRKGYKAGTGIKRGTIKRLIDDTESITITFGQPVIVDMLSINRLFDATHRKDMVNEVALVSTDAGDFTLEALNRIEATWSGPGDATQLMTSEVPMGGRRMVHAHGDPAGIFGAPVTRIVFKSAIPGPKYKFSDFSFVGLEFEPAPLAPIHTPAPATVPAFIVMGVAAARRKRPSAG